MKAYRTLDYALAIDIFNRMFDEVSEDDIESYVPDVVNEYWVALAEEETIIGLYRLHQLNAITYQIHALILSEHRERHAKESGRIILQWCLDNLDFHKLVAEIPELYRNVYHFTKGQGFQDEGINRESFRKNGKIHNAYRLGMTRKEVESWLVQ